MKTDDVSTTDVNITSSSSSSATAVMNCETVAGECSTSNNTNIVAQNPNSLLSDHYVQLMKKATTLEQTLDVIRQALEATGVHVFGELLHMPNVQAVSNSLLIFDTAMTFNIIFAAGEE